MHAFFEIFRPRRSMELSKWCVHERKLSTSISMESYEEIQNAWAAHVNNFRPQNRTSNDKHFVRFSPNKWVFDLEPQ